eukprot:5297969-Pyramimonas_sp.AAC.1
METARVQPRSQAAGRSPEEIGIEVETAHVQPCSQEEEGSPTEIEVDTSPTVVPSLISEAGN